MKKFNKYLIYIYSALIFSKIYILNSNLALANSSCEKHLESNGIFISPGYDLVMADPYTLGKDTDPIHVQKANLIRLALKEAFPLLDIIVNPNSLPKKLDTLALINFFYDNSIGINLIFSGFTKGQIIITDHTSIATYADNHNHALQLRFEVANEFGSAFFHPLAKLRPLDRQALVQQWQMFLTMITGKSPKIIK